MSEFSKSELRLVVSFLAERMKVHPDEIHVAIAMVLSEYLGDWIARLPSFRGTDDSLMAVTARLEAMLHLFITDLPSAMDKYLSEAMVHSLWIATLRQSQLAGRPVEALVGMRCSGESIVLSLALLAVFEQKQRLITHAHASLESMLGVSFAQETCGGGCVEYCEKLLERHSST
jgi:hypothetical protein